MKWPVIFKKREDGMSMATMRERAITMRDYTYALVEHLDRGAPVPVVPVFATEDDLFFVRTMIPRVREHLNMVRYRLQADGYYEVTS